MTKHNVLRFEQRPSGHWRKSSYSGTAGNCIEVAELHCESRTVRDSKNSAGPTLTVTAKEWTAFTARICAGEFD